MKTNVFFKNKGPIKLEKIITACSPISFPKNTSLNIFDIKDLISASDKDITFLNSSKYKELSINTKATACITTQKLQKFLPNDCKAIIVENLMLNLAKVTKLFYPDAQMDRIDNTLISSDKIKDKYNKVSFGQNVLIGENVIIGINSFVGSNTIIEHNVSIGENCLIGSFVTLKNTIVEDNVCIQSGCKIGQMGFGFIPDKKKNYRIPHIGSVILRQGVELGVNCTIDRGSLSNTIIDENSFLDNQVHVAHNVKIGKNCMIAGQVGIAGSSTLGNNVVIGGQAGISGHLKIGNNVQIGGGSGVIKDVPDNSKIMGYPSINFRDFIRKMEL